MRSQSPLGFPFGNLFVPWAFLHDTADNPVKYVRIKDQHTLECRG
jgi:hypothetical protein